MGLLIDVLLFAAVLYLAIQLRHQYRVNEHQIKINKLLGQRIDVARRTCQARKVK